MGDEDFYNANREQRKRLEEEYEEERRRRDEERRLEQLEKERREKEEAQRKKDELKNSGQIIPPPVPYPSAHSPLRDFVNQHFMAVLLAVVIGASLFRIILPSWLEGIYTVIFNVVVGTLLAALGVGIVVLLFKAALSLIKEVLGFAIVMSMLLGIFLVVRWLFWSDSPTTTTTPPSPTKAKIIERVKPKAKQTKARAPVEVDK